ncbi:MAG: hypothetical protein ACR2LI_06395 [Propionibacteriaceae bacterium]
MERSTWSQTLAYALGADGADVSGVDGPPSLGPVVQALGGAERLAELAARCRRTQGRWPRPVDRPEDLGPAQWSALLSAAARVVGHAEAERSGRVLRGGAPDADERRLLRDVPPHHGS